MPGLFPACLPIPQKVGSKLMYTLVDIHGMFHVMYYVYSTVPQISDVCAQWYCLLL